ncbi:MAG: XRE family transcriptional regulator [Verrucomicrobiae bacterium]|nr:XRE family transcriptional regulator [Verrucomicrobiae bacterium]
MDARTEQRAVIRERFRVALKNKGITQQELADISKASVRTLSRISSDGFISSATAEKIAPFLGVSDTYLRARSDDPTALTSDTSFPVNLVSRSTADDEMNAVYDPDEVKVPLYRMVSVCAGYGVDNGICTPEMVRRIPLKRRDLGRSPDDAYIAVEVSGTSMEPRIPDGSTVVVDRSKKTPQRGDVCYVRFRKNGGFEKDAVKFVYPTRDGGLELKSAEGSGFPSEIFSAEDLKSGYVEIVGEVILKLTIEKV